MTTTNYRVVGLRSAADMATLMDSVAGIAGVTRVDVDLRGGKPSRLAIRANGVMSPAQVRDRLTGAGMRVVVADASEPVELQRTFTGIEPDLHRAGGA